MPETQLNKNETAPQTKQRIIKPLASSFPPPRFPRTVGIKPFHSLRVGTKITLVPSASNLYINRSLSTIPPGVPTIAIQGEKQFVPSEELSQKILRTQILPLLKKEVKEEEVTAATIEYQEQLRSLREAQRKIEEKILQTQKEIEELQEKLPAAKETEEIQEKISSLEKHLEKLVQHQQEIQVTLKKPLEKEGVIVPPPPEEKLEAKKILKESIAEKRAELASLQVKIEQLTAQHVEEETLLEKQETEVQKLLEERERISAFADILSQQLSEITSQRLIQEAVQLPPLPKPKMEAVKAVRPIPLKRKLPQLSKRPNVINGIVRDTQGQLLSGALVIIKTQTGQPQRALRTNNLGQFIITTPLPNGVYHLETIKEPSKFDIIEIELEGSVLEPIEIQARSKKEEPEKKT